MPRPKRILIPGAPHHLTQRGNNKRLVFLCDEDQKRYLSLLFKYSSKRDLKILSYCLMPNHIHIVAIPKDKKSISAVLQSTQSQYSTITNSVYGNSGHIWQQRYFSCPMDNKHLVAALRYVEQNPVRAGLVKSPADYKWSSASAHVTGADPFNILDMKWWNRKFDPEAWSDFLIENLPDNELTQIREQTKTGTPLSGKRFLKKVSLCGFTGNINQQQPKPAYCQTS